MKLYPVKIPGLIKKRFPRYTWSGNPENRSVYLTIDDGPTPVLGENILDILSERQVNATFFCVGENLLRNREVAERALSEGHVLANHTHNHMNGWKTGEEEYLDNVEKCQKQLLSLGINTRLFRPPYGRITKKKGIRLVSEGYDIIMWDLLSGDFEKDIAPAHCLNRTLNHTEAGTIVVFHDNEKCRDTLEYVLPRYIDSLLEGGYNFKTL